MSSNSMRKLGQKPTHKERAQPVERQKLGILEKHKDYSLRAKDFSKKKAYLKTLRQKAAERNEDEFYHKMLSRRGPGSVATRKGKGSFTGTVDGDRGNRPLDVDVVRLLKTQDQGYLRTMRNVLAKEVADLEQRVAVAASFAGVKVEDVELVHDADSDDDEDSRRTTKRRKPNKIVFSTDAEERDVVMGDSKPPKPPADDDGSDGGGGFEGFDDDDGDGDDDAAEKEADSKAEKVAKLSRKLNTARRRLKALTTAENQLELQRARMAKTATVSSVTKSGRKIKIRERKR